MRGTKALKKKRMAVPAIAAAIFAITTLYSPGIDAQALQVKGLPFITNYRYQDYHSNGVNWWAEEDDKGVMYFANESGILIYDGTNWETIEPTGYHETRSLAKGKDGRIYIGTNGDIGYLQREANGSMHFTSLKGLIPEEHRSFREVWQTDLFDGKIYFLTTNKIYVWDYQQFQVFENKAGFHIAEAIHGHYYVRIWDTGLTVLENGSFHLVPQGEKFKSERIYAMIPYDEQRILIGTRTQGMFLYDGKTFTPFKTEADPYVANTSLYGGKRLSNGLFALNTFNDGMVIIDKNGKLIQRLDKSVGLQDNSVDYLYEDSRGILWLCLFNGISRIDLHSPLTYFDESKGLPLNTVFSIGYNDGILYAGTNNGVYYLDPQSSRFRFVAGTSGQIYSFAKNGKDFLVGAAENGMMKLNGGVATSVIPSLNYQFHVGQLTRSKVDSTEFVVGLRTGLAIVRYTPANGKYAVESFREDIRPGGGNPFIETTEGNLWFPGENPGEVKLLKIARHNGKIDLKSSEIKIYGHEKGLPSGTGGLGELEDTLWYVRDKDSIFYYAAQQDRFIRDTNSFQKKYLDIEADGTQSQAVDAKGRTWLNMGSGVLAVEHQKDGSRKIIDAPFRELTRDYPVWFIKPTLDKDSNEVVWFAGRRGIIRYDGDLNDIPNTSFQTIIRNVKLNEDSVFFSGFVLPGEAPRISKKWNSVRIDYAAAFYKQESESVFSTFLEGRDKGWSAWNKQSFREMGNLPAGKYTFHVKGKNIYGTESPEATFSFNILPAWYATWWAYLLYALAAMTLISLIVRYRTRHLQEQHRELEKIVENRTMELKQRVEELAVINSVQEGLVREMDIKSIYDLVGDKLCDLFPDTQTLVIRTFDHEKGIENFQYAIEKGVKLTPVEQPLKWTSQQLIRTRQPLLINSGYVEKARSFGESGVTVGEPPKSAVFVPMTVGEVVKGSISLQNVDRENAFTDSDLRLLTTLSNSMSVALENARLFDETNRLLAESKQRASELGTVNNISKALTSQVNPDDLINLVGEQMRQLFKANIVYLAILDAKTRMINFPYQYGDNMEPMMLGEGLTSKIILTGEPLLINKDLEELREQMGVRQIGVRAASYLGVPIPVGDEVIGVLSVQSTEHENRFNEDDLRLLTTIAASVGITLRKARLFEEVEIAKREAESARKNAEKANEAKSAFLSTVSHELRTPLTSVLGFAKIIRKRLEEKIFPATDKSDPKTEKTIAQISGNLDVVVSEGERLTHLINDVLDLAKIEAGKMEWNMETVALPEVAERAVAVTTSLFENSNLELIKDIDHNIPPVSGDHDKLIQVMVNLVSNAVKFTPKGTVTLRVRQEKNEIITSVSDTGIGIAPEDHGSVFEQFKQVGDTLTDKPKGTGLGLPICKEIVEHHGGRLWLESDIGKGSTFHFAIPITKTTTGKPVHVEDLVRQLKEQVAQSQLQFKERAARLLIVDDDDSIRSLLQQELSEAGYQIEEASNGKEALVRVRANRPDLIILDIMMPEMNGFDVAAVLKNDPETMDIPIIVLSVVQDKTRGFRVGVDRYLTKPIDTGLLFNEIGSLLEQGKSKKKVMIVDEDSGTVSTLTEVLKTKGYEVLESDGRELVERAVASQPDIIIINSILTGKEDVVQTLRFEKGLENVLFLVYQ